jgi:exonuclease SbcC
VRPTRLSIQGLTAYRQPVEVDFSQLDLFAITGDTGSGKSSLVDAISFALFGQAPRVGSRVRELISQGEDRLKVSLEFRSNGARYRIHRETGRRGQKPPQIERFDAGQDEWLPEEPDRVRDANAFIERLLQMDYEAFVRSVLLPQGQFQQFLAGDRDERRKVLDQLLGLDVFRRMEVRANAIAREADGKATDIARRLETELADATPDALKQAKAGLKALQERAKELASLREATDAAARAAGALADARKRRDEAARSQADAEKRLKLACELMAGGQKALDTADARLAGVRKQIQAADYDAGLHLRLTQCVPLLRAIGRAAENESKLAGEVAKAGPSLKKLEAEEQTSRKQAEDAAAGVKTQHDAYEAARHTNAAALLRTGLKKGDPCPVCGQAVAVLPPGEKATALDKLKTAWEKAQAAENAARERLADAEKRLVREREALSAKEQQLAAAKSDRESRTAELRAVLPDPALDQKTIEPRIAALEKARTHLEELTAREKEAIEEREKTAREIEAAKTGVTQLEIRAKAHASEAEAAARLIAELEAGLRTAAREMDWPDIIAALDREQDPAPMLTGRLRDLQGEEREANQGIGAAGKHIEQIGANIELAKRLRDEEKGHRKAGLLARDLASLLRIDALPSFIRERALETLAQDGSRRLEEISGGRYDFAVDGQDFLIVDKWNGGETRSVRTLSGGETFLASLALALSLAEQLPSLGGRGAGSALESLFIDEGFSHLDAETLDTVASALEVLGEDRRRLIGVITHVPALAERMPARITVHKSQAGSTVTVE